MDAVADLAPGSGLIAAACTALGLSRASLHRRQAFRRQPLAAVRPRPSRLASIAATRPLGVSFASIFSLFRAYRAALEQCNGSLKSAFRAMCAPFVAALLMGCAVIAVQETLFTALPLAVRLTVSIAVGILAYGLILIGLFRDHVSDDMAMVKAALFSRLRS